MTFIEKVSGNNGNRLAKCLSIVTILSLHFFLFILFTKFGVCSRKTEQLSLRNGMFFITKIASNEIFLDKKFKKNPNSSQILSKTKNFKKDDEIVILTNPEISTTSLPDSSNISAPVPLDRNTAMIMEQAKRDIGKIDRELRGKSPIVSTDIPDSFRARLERGISDAYIGHSESTMEHYTSPDGVIYTRISKNGRSFCYMSGTVNFVPGILHSGDSEKSVNCPPASSGWAK